MKTSIALLALALGAICFGQDPVPVYLDPVADAPQIGELETASLAVPAQWPSGVDPQDEWQPIYYRGTFEVYLDNNDMGKDLAPKPGSLYYLEPSKDSIRLTIATEKDKTDILAVDTWWCKMRLETILVGYIRSQSSSPAAAVSTPPLQPSAPKSGDASAIRELVGTLQATGILAKSRVGLDFKLIDAEGKALAFIDTSGLPDRVSVSDLLDTQVRVSGVLVSTDQSDTLILRAQSIKKAN